MKMKSQISLIACSLFFFGVCSIAVAQNDEVDDYSAYRYWIDKGDAMFEKGQYDVAISFYKKHLEEYPEDVEAMGGCANASQMLGNNQVAITHCKNALKIDPSYVRAYTLMAAAYRNMSNHDEAISNCKKAIAIDPSEAFAYGIMGDVYFARKEYQKAIEMIKKCIAIDIEHEYENASAYAKLAMTYLNIGDQPSAKLHLQKALAINDRYLPAIAELTNIYYNQEQYDSALALWHRVINENLLDNNANAYGSLAMDYEGKGDYASMVKYSQLAFEGDQENDFRRSYYARALRLNGDLRKASELLLRAKKQDNSELANIYFCLGDAEQSKRYSALYIAELKKLAKKGEDVDVNMGWAFLLSHNMDEAIRQSRLGTQTEGNSIAELNIALAYLCKGDIQNARATYKQTAKNAKIRELRAAIHDIRCAASNYSFGGVGDELIDELEAEIEKRKLR